MGYQRGQEGSTKKHLNVNELHRLDSVKNELQSKITQREATMKIYNRFLLGKPLNEQEKLIVNKILEAQSVERKKEQQKANNGNLLQKSKIFKN